MISGFLLIALLQSSVVFSAVFAPQTRGSDFKTREVNVHAPNFYADKLDFVATLVDLPGAQNKQSYWELSYQLYFIPEEKYFEAVRRLPRGGSNPTPEQFPGRILLAEGRRKKTRINTLKERTIMLAGVPFKQKIPDAQRTKFAILMTSYSVKIFDARLNTTVYRSGIFLTEPFAPDQTDRNRQVARETIYLNFGVNPDGTLNRSQTARTKNDTTWQ
jgi:hypothetical protein